MSRAIEPESRDTSRMRDNEHLALRKKYEAALAEKGHELGRWNGVLDDKYAYCQRCDGKIIVYATRADNPNTGGRRFKHSKPGTVLIADGSLFNLPACPRARR